MKKHALTLLAVASLLGSVLTAAPASATVSIPSAPQVNTAVATKKVVKKVSKKTTSNVHLRTGAGTKHRSIRVLKKGTVLTVLSSKSGWTKVSVKIGQKTYTGWASSKHLGNVAAKKAAPKKAAPKKTSKTVSLGSVNSWNSAANWAKKTCSGIKVSKRGQGVRGHAYSANAQTILLGRHEASNRYGFVAAHEMAHHYQWHYYNNVYTWNAKIKDRSLETEADRMAYVIMGNKWVKPFYTQKKPTKAQRDRALKIIAVGKARGC